MVVKRLDYKKCICDIREAISLCGLIYNNNSRFFGRELLVDLYSLLEENIKYDIRYKKQGAFITALLCHSLGAIYYKEKKNEIAISVLNKAKKIYNQGTTPIYDIDMMLSEMQETKA